MIRDAKYLRVKYLLFARLIQLRLSTVLIFKTYVNDEAILKALSNIFKNKTSIVKRQNRFTNFG